MSLFIVEKMTDGIVTLDLRGRIVLGRETAALREAVSNALEAGQEHLILNLEGVDYIDSSGLSTLVACYTTVKKRNGEVKLANLTSRVRGMLQITHLTMVFKVFDTEDEARRSFLAG
jgi:anti-sigma B factor antagonist